jgi:hypothetical protein
MEITANDLVVSSILHTRPRSLHLDTCQPRVLQKNSAGCTIPSHISQETYTNPPPVYTAGRNSFEAAENIWEGVFGIVASIIITLMGAALLRVSKLQDKWRVKISKVLENKDSKLPVKGRAKRWMEKYAMFILPFVTVLREGIEAVLYVPLIVLHGYPRS